MVQLNSVMECLQNCFFIALSNCQYGNYSGFMWGYLYALIIRFCVIFFYVPGVKEAQRRPIWFTLLFATFVTHCLAITLEFFYSQWKHHWNVNDDFQCNRPRLYGGWFSIHRSEPSLLMYQSALISFFHSDFCNTVDRKYWKKVCELEKLPVSCCITGYLVIS